MTSKEMISDLESSKEVHAAVMQALGSDLLTRDEIIQGLSGSTGFVYFVSYNVDLGDLNISPVKIEKAEK